MGRRLQRDVRPLKVPRQSELPESPPTLAVSPKPTNLPRPRYLRPEQHADHRHETTAKRGKGRTRWKRWSRTAPLAPTLCMGWPIRPNARPVGETHTEQGPQSTECPMLKALQWSSVYLRSRAA